MQRKGPGSRKFNAIEGINARPHSTDSRSYRTFVSDGTPDRCQLFSMNFRKAIPTKSDTGKLAFIFWIF